MKTESFEKWTNQRCFTDAFRFMDWTSRNCDRCIKASHYNEEKDEYTIFRCSIQQEFIMQLEGFNDSKVSHRTYDICQKIDCPFIRTTRKKSQPKIYKSIKSLFDQS